ncbi:hypothetical protein QCA50_001212 [Cerrena zonata]|uniref:Transcription factor CBF/NF-Y/archaeal histone domain-containing protein n=1 Tax=Cerrena zonata TaxID=2478898 RepID=A0AAW0GWD4_9APHY
MTNNNEPFVRAGEPLADFLRSFWQRQIDTAEQETPDYRHPPLPLARIKKVMKSDPDVKMIAADAPILFCKACEIFIAEITARAFIIADSNKRRTLSRADIAKAISKSDQFDFLIDILPREDPLGGASQAAASSSKPPARKASAEAKEEEMVGTDSRGLPLNMGHGEGSSHGGMAGSDVLDQLQTLLNPSGGMERSGS